MASVRAFAASSLAVLLAVMAGCGDNADDLAAARGKKKPTTTPPGGVAPETTVGQTPGGLTTTTPTQTTTPTTAACQPRQVGQIAAPQWRPPNPLHRQLCTQGEASAIVNCYIGQQTQACDTQISVQCHDCVVTELSDPGQGAIIFNSAQPSDVQLNVEGCVASMSGDASQNGCGYRMAVTEACKMQACAGCTDPNQLAACYSAAAQGSCAQYAQASNTCAQQYLTTCMPSQDKLQLAFALARAFCM